MTRIEGLSGEATLLILLSGWLGLWTLLRRIQKSRRYICLSLLGYAALACVIGPRAHAYYLPPVIAKNLTLSGLYFKKNATRPTIVSLKGSYLRHFFFGKLRPPIISHQFAPDEAYGLMLGLGLEKYGATFRDITFTVFANDGLEMVPPPDPIQISHPKETRWNTAVNMAGRKLSHSAKAYDAKSPLSFPAPRMIAKKKGKYLVRWNVRGIALNEKGEATDLGVVEGRFILELY